MIVQKRVTADPDPECQKKQDPCGSESLSICKRTAIISPDLPENNFEGIYKLDINPPIEFR